MRTITESGPPGAKTANRIVVGFIAVAAIGIAVSLGALLALLIARAGLSADPKLGVVLSLMSSFVVFFAVIAVQATTYTLRPRGELMPIRAWQILSGTLALLGIACGFAFHWVAMAPWLAMALICMLKDPRVQSWLRKLGI